MRRMSLIALSTLIVSIGLAPGVQAQDETRAQPGGLAALARSGVAGPIIVVALVKFKPGGEERYNQYDAIAEAKVKSLGGEIVFRGFSKPVEGLDSEAWDRVTFRKYPSVQAVLDMGGSPEYQGAFPHRLASVEKSLVYAFSGELPSLGGIANAGRDPMQRIPPAPSADTVYMLNLLRFKKDSGRAAYYGDYGAKVILMVHARGGKPVMSLKGIGAVVSDEAIDRLILVSYPAPDRFREMITSAEYQAIAHLRTDAIELGLLFPFSNDRVASGEDTSD